MRYSKPEIVVSAEAVRGIQGTISKQVQPRDNKDLVFTAPAAYEADE